DGGRGNARVGCGRLYNERVQVHSQIASSSELYFYRTIVVRIRGNHATCPRDSVCDLGETCSTPIRRTSQEENWISYAEIGTRKKLPEKQRVPCSKGMNWNLRTVHATMR